MHSDLHPGNILVQPEGPRFVLLDAGLTTELLAHERNNFIQLLQAFGDGDGRAAARSAAPDSCSELKISGVFCQHRPLGAVC